MLRQAGSALLRAPDAQWLPVATLGVFAQLQQLHTSSAAAAAAAAVGGADATPPPPTQLQRGVDQEPPANAGAQQRAHALLYATHTPLHPLQKGAVAMGAALGALLRPARADWVALVGETLGDGAVRRMAQRMRDSATGRQVLAERPRVTDAAVARCWELPPHTFGGAYAQFMGSRGFSADERPVVRVVDDEELAYVVTRAREVHDFWHVLTGCHTNVFGELALKALEFVQTGLPMAGMAVAGAQFKLSAADRSLLWQAYLPWAAQTGLRCADLMCIYYEHHFDEDLAELRARWRITPAPPPPQHLAPKPAAAAAAAQEPPQQQHAARRCETQQQHEGGVPGGRVAGSGSA